jgi:2,4-dienoyl-CoA reductase-like NADH-dependent reductase (Old Yellow Enzyme family)/thioredoxin reductase
MATEYTSIFEPLTIGPVTVPNRLFVSAHHTELTHEDPEGFGRWSMLSDRARAYYEDRAKGGFGLQIIGQTQVHPQSGIDRPASFLPAVVERYQSIADACHRHGGKVFVQLNQNGREKFSSGPDSWDPVWSVSPAPVGWGEMAKEMDKDDIAGLIDGFVRSARHCQEAGTDGVEIHAAHPHLLGVWLVPAFNHRTDEYGGSLENRLRIVVEIVDAVRSAVGSGFAVGVRMNGAWVMPGGQTVEESIFIAKALEATGQVDFLDVSAVPTIGSIGTPFGALIPWAAEVKKAVPAMPVFGAGRIVTPEQAEAIVSRGDVDMVAMTRASIADPELPVKARTGRAGQVRVCIGAGQGCLMRNRHHRPITCQQNPAVGREQEWGIGTLTPAAERRRVLVVGGGPAGMEAAVVAAARGHDVTLLEQQDALGGQIRLIARNARREEFNRITDWRVDQLKDLGVDVQLGTAATPELVLEAKADRVVVATGAAPRRDGWYPAVPHLDSLAGYDRPHVVSTWDALTDLCLGATHVVVIDAHGYHQTTDVVERLAARGQRVTVLSPTAEFAAQVDDHDRPDLMAALRDAPVEFILSAIVEEIGETTVTARDAYRGGTITVEDVDRVVLSTGTVPVDGLYRSLCAVHPSVVRIGDCVTPRGVEHAIHEGHRAGREV